MLKIASIKQYFIAMTFILVFLIGLEIKYDDLPTCQMRFLDQNF